MEKQILGEEVDIAIGKLKKGTSPGWDGSTPELLFFIYELVPSLIKDFVQEFLEEKVENRLNLLVKKIILLKNQIIKQTLNN